MPVFRAATIDLARAVNAVASGCVIDPDAFGELVAPPSPTPITRQRIVRPDDLLVADFEFHNLSVGVGAPPQLIRTQPSRNAHLALELQGQHFGEEVLIVGDVPAELPDDLSGSLRNTPPPPPHVMKARLAHPSRIVVRMPETEMAVDFTLDALLDAVTSWPLSLDPLARGAWLVIDVLQTPPISEALAHERLATAVETLRPVAYDLEKALVAREHAALARTIAGMATRTADRAIEAVRRDAPTAGEAREAASALDKRLAADQTLDEETRETATALFEVVLAERIATRATRPVRRERMLSAGVFIQAAPAIMLFLFPHRPGSLVTALELPYRLIQSPHAGTVFDHPRVPVSFGGRTELWRTTLKRRTASGPEPLGPNGTPVTALWSPDYGDSVTAKKDPFRMSLFPRHRDQLVRLMSGHNERVGRRSYTPMPAYARRLQLSAWGGVLEADGSWSVLPDGVGVEAWNHDASYGRDERVRVVEAGFLFPYGHRASLVTLTERLIEDQNPVGCGAFLRQRQFIEVREFEKSFPAPGQVFAGRKLPFTKLICLTRRTPSLQQGTHPTAVVHGVGGAQAFWPVGVPGSSPVRFDFEAIDIAGRRVAFSSPVIFVVKTFVDTAAAQLYKVHDDFAGPLPTINPRSRITFGGQTVRMAPLDGGKPGDVDVPIDEVVFEGTVAAGYTPPFHPAIRCADARLKALEGVTGRATSETVEYETSRYLPQGYIDSPWKIFLQLKSPFKVRMGPDVPTDKVGGIGQPTQDLSAISNGRGAVSGSVSALTAGSVQPADMFPEAKILGAFDLKDLIAPFIAAAAGAIPGFKTEEFADRIVTSWEFKDDEVNSPIPGLVTGAGGAKSALELSAKLTAHFTYPDPDLGFKNKDGEPAPDFGAGTDPGFKDPEAEATGRLTNFKLNFFGFVIVWFDEFSLKSSLKNKFDPNPKLNDDNPVVFGGPLEFVNKLSKLIPGGGFSDPPIVKPSFTDLQVGYDFKLPKLPLGIFLLNNMKIGAVLKIPFTGDPVALRFFFNTREAPFLLTVSLFGGGGFFAIVTTADGVQEIEAAFEFGAFAAFDVGVASGGIYVKGGVYFHWKTDAVTLEGYVEMGGELSVLGLISVSVTLHLSLGYYKQSGEAFVRGQATLKIEVELLFFSTTVRIQVERRFAGSDADPSFAQLITDQPTWARYCLAFA